MSKELEQMYNYVRTNLVEAGVLHNKLAAELLINMYSSERFRIYMTLRKNYIKISEKNKDDVRLKKLNDTITSLKPKVDAMLSMQTVWRDYLLSKKEVKKYREYWELVKNYGPSIKENT